MKIDRLIINRTCQFSECCITMYLCKFDQGFFLIVSFKNDKHKYRRDVPRLWLHDGKRQPVWVKNMRCATKPAIHPHLAGVFAFQLVEPLSTLLDFKLR